MKEKFRLSPTPSGYLHSGNALNFVLNWWQARLRGASLLLRIDDHDETRMRREYVEDIFNLLRWLGLDWDEGPKDADDFEENFSQRLRKEEYRNFLKKVPNTFWCQCSRSDLKKFDGVYPGTCRELDLQGESLSLRVNTDQMNDIPSDLKDCVLWRKDDLPAYQLVSLYEDLQSEVTHVLRGKDLYGSSIFQKELGRIMGKNLKTEFFHHELITMKGEKISKSQKASSVRQEFKTSEEFYQECVSPQLRQWFGAESDVKSASELLAAPFKKPVFP